MPRGERSSRAGERPLAVRLQALARAVELLDARLPAAALESARTVSARATGRLAITGDATVVAVAGATGSGKSSTVNALAGAAVAEPGVRRPTTSRALAVTFGDDDQHELLDWLDLAARRRLPGMVGTSDLDGLVLVDLPDHDSTAADHRAEVDRLVELVDLVVWIVDPQKYADAALHEDYLLPMARHAPTMTVLLNQIDLLAAPERERVLADLADLLDREGLAAATVLPISATTGEGIDLVREQLASAVAAKIAATQRMSVDVDAALSGLAERIGQAGTLTRSSRTGLVESLAVAAGVPTVVDAVVAAWRKRGARATGWPLVAWLGSLRPDPLRRLHLDAAPLARALAPGGPPTGRTSLPGAAVERSRVDSAVRAVVASAVGDLPDGWADAVRAAARSGVDGLPDDLDRAVARTDLDLHRHRRWWHLVTVLQWILTVIGVAGLGWHLIELVLSWLGFPPLPSVTWQGVPAASWMLVGALGAGVVTSGVSRVAVEVGARRRARRARSRLHAAVAEVAEEQILRPVEAELARHRDVAELVSSSRR